jgi:hypothetical protein
MRRKICPLKNGTPATRSRSLNSLGAARTYMKDVDDAPAARSPIPTNVGMAASAHLPPGWSWQRRLHSWCGKGSFTSGLRRTLLGPDRSGGRGCAWTAATSRHRGRAHRPGRHADYRGAYLREFDDSVCGNSRSQGPRDDWKEPRSVRRVTSQQPARFPSQPVYPFQPDFLHPAGRTVTAAGSQSADHWRRGQPRVLDIGSPKPFSRGVGRSGGSRNRHRAVLRKRVQGSTRRSRYLPGAPADRD